MKAGHAACKKPARALALTRPPDVRAARSTGTALCEKRSRVGVHERREASSGTGFRSRVEPRVDTVGTMHRYGGARAIG